MHVTAIRSRRYIVLGAATDAGGKVVSASSLMLLDGVPRALEGDLVSCPACGTEGRIACDGARLAVSENGRRPALEDDLCLCGCSPAPRLLASQERWRQWVSAEM